MPEILNTTNAIANDADTPRSSRGRRLPTTIPDGDTPIWGARNIGLVIGRSQAATYYLLESGALGNAVKKVNGRWCGRPSKLREAVS
jgi:hypothetical protein